MKFPRFTRSALPYEMLHLASAADEAKTLDKCERIYHRGQDLAWDGKALLAELLEKHNGIQLTPERREAVERIFSIIMWGELAAWRISAQLADALVPMAAKMAATSQAHDEARHFYVMHDYLQAIGYQPQRLARAPEALLETVLLTDNLAHKLVGMQLMIETLALTIFQSVRETNVEPVLCEILRYFERDEARHVGLGVQYLPQLMKSMSRREITALVMFQCKIAFWAMCEAKFLEPDFTTVGVDTRELLERGRKKQLAVTQEAFEALGLTFNKQRNPMLVGFDAALEYFFPKNAPAASHWSRLKQATRRAVASYERIGLDELDAHTGQEIRTARGVVAPGEPMAQS